MGTGTGSFLQWLPGYSPPRPGTRSVTSAAMNRMHRVCSMHANSHIYTVTYIYIYIYTHRYAHDLADACAEVSMRIRLFGEPELGLYLLQTSSTSSLRPETLNSKPKALKKPFYKPNANLKPPKNSKPEAFKKPFYTPHANLKPQT